MGGRCRTKSRVERKYPASVLEDSDGWVNDPWGNKKTIANDESVTGLKPGLIGSGVVLICLLSSLHYLIFWLLTAFSFPHQPSPTLQLNDHQTPSVSYHYPTSCCARRWLFCCELADMVWDTIDTYRKKETKKNNKKRDRILGWTPRGGLRASICIRLFPSLGSTAEKPENPRHDTMTIESRKNVLGKSTG